MYRRNTTKKRCKSFVSDKSSHIYKYTIIYLRVLPSNHLLSTITMTISSPGIHSRLWLWLDTQTQDPEPDYILVLMIEQKNVWKGGVFCPESRNAHNAIRVLKSSKIKKKGGKIVISQTIFDRFSWNKDQNVRIFICLTMVPFIIFQNKLKNTIFLGNICLIYAAILYKWYQCQKYGIYIVLPYVSFIYILFL